MVHTNDLTSNTQFTISHETITLLRWLVEHHAEELKALIQKTLPKGLYASLYKKTTNTLPSEEQTHANIADFFALMEILLAECGHDYAAQKAKESRLRSTIDHIDATLCDAITLNTSIERATTQHENHPEQNARDLLFKELLKQWTPHKKSVVN